MANGMRKLTLTVLIALGIMVTIYVMLNTRKDYSEESETIHISELISASIELVGRGGRKVVVIRNLDDSQINLLSKGLTKEGKNQYVTMGDKVSNQVIVSGLMSLWPSIPFQSEESDMPQVAVPPVSTYNEEVQSMAMRDEAVPLKEITVWIDPLDATYEYIEGKKNPSLLEYVTVMICIAVRGTPIAGIINQPFKESSQGITKWAWLKHGISDTLRAATLVNDASEDLKVTYSRSHPGDASEVADAAFKNDGSRLVHVPAAGSGYKTLQVVERKNNLYLHTTEIKKWDICAGNAILNAVGGKMTTLKGQEIDYSFNGSPLNKDGLVAAMPESAHQKYLNKVKSAMSRM